MGAHGSSFVLRCVAAALICWSAGPPVSAQSNPPLPGDLEAVGIDERLDALLPLDLEFADEAGRAVRLGQFFQTGRPVVLSLVYYECPMLCTLVLGGLVDVLREIDWVPGDQFEVLSISIDPREKPQLARLKKQSYLESYGRAGADRGWHFLTAEQESIRTLADAVGFRYRYLEDRDEFAHPAALFVITPEGRVSRYFYGVRHDPRTMRLSLVEASEGKVGSALDRFLLYCYRYDADEKRYAPVAMNLMRLGGGVAVLILGAVLYGLWRREAGQKRTA